MVSPPSKRSPAHQRWTLDDIPWHAIRRDEVADQELLFYLVTTASFIETATDTYAHNLIKYYSGDEEATAWLEQHWQHEKLRYGLALKRYVQVAWPTFDWDEVYRGLFAEFSAHCKVEALEPTRCLEMASRCIVETGTSGYYTALGRFSPDVVLRLLAQCIRENEVRHYKYFFRYLLLYRERENTSRVQVLKTVWRRLRMINGDDSRIALKHAYAIRYSGEPFDNRLYRKIQKRARYLLGAYFHHEMSVKMVLEPLHPGPRVQRLVQPAITTLSRYLLWGKWCGILNIRSGACAGFYLRLRACILNQWTRFTH